MMTKAEKWKPVGIDLEKTVDTAWGAASKPRRAGQ